MINYWFIHKFLLTIKFLKALLFKTISIYSINLSNLDDLIKIKYFYLILDLFYFSFLNFIIKFSLYMRTLLLILFLYILLIPKAMHSQVNLGVNVVNDGAFVNIVNQTNRYNNATGFDSNGWPTSNFSLVVLDGRPVAEWSGSIDDPEEYRVDYSGVYKGSFEGMADLSVSGTAVSLNNINYNSSTNITSFELNLGGYGDNNHGFVVLTFNNTKRTANSSANSGISKLKINRPGYDLENNQIFTNEYISLCKAADFNCYRFYNVQNIWEGEPKYPAKSIWQNRKLPEDASQIDMSKLNGKKDGWCWEYIVALANILNRDIWINIHISCDSNYVAELGKFLNDKLNKSINIYVENSNEVWSPTQLTHGPYNKAEADFYKINFNQNYARRCVELSNWFANIFGKNEINKRIRIILAGQQAYNGRSDLHLNYIKNTFGEPKEFIYATSTALYFNTSKPKSNDINEINEGMLSEINNQIEIDTLPTYRQNHIKKAKDWGLVGGCTSYEGGPHVPASGGLDNLANLINSHRTEKMGEVLKYNYKEAWNDLGGGLAMQFTLASAYNRYGCWGLTDDYTNPERNYKMKAMRELLSKSSEVNIKNNLLNIYPNPANDVIYFNFVINSDVIIYDLLGNIVLKEFVSSSYYNISILKNGIYLLKVQDKIFKIVKC